MNLLLSILLIVGGIQSKGFEVKLKQYLAERLKEYEKFEYQLIRTPQGFSEIEINTEKNFRLSKNYAYVPVKIKYAGKNESFSLLTIRVKLFKTVLVAGGKIEKGKNLSSSLFEKKLVDISELDNRIAGEEEAGISRSKVIINQGSILLKEMIEEIPAVYSGDKVLLHTGKNGVDITVEATCRQDGCPGDVISVQAQNKIFKAKVVDKYNLTLVE